MELNLNKIQKVHFVGIGGIGISAIARMMIGLGKEVSGQDMQSSEITKDLENLGAKIMTGQSYENIPESTDLIVYTIAIEYYDSNFFEKLKSQNIPIRSYPEMLGIISKDKYTIAVCGTHGKTTTTGMIARILVDAKKDPTVIIGSLIKIHKISTQQKEENLSALPSLRGLRHGPNSSSFVSSENTIKTNFIKGESDLFVVEACEYRRSFLNINPNIVVITNIEEDHLDYYKDIEDIINAFREFVEKVPEDGFIVCDTNGKNISTVIKNVKCTVIDYMDFYDENLKLKVPGIHNKMDAAGAMAVASQLSVYKQDSIKFLSEFSGTWRRFEYKGKLESGALIYDDYAHHPTEIKATLQGFRELYPKDDGWKIIVVFQPHLFSRTKLLLDEFANSFFDADEVLILPIYYARETDDGSVSSEILSKKININEGIEKSQAFLDFQSAEDAIRQKTLNEKEIIVTMGAGEAHKIGENLFK